MAGIVAVYGLVVSVLIAGQIDDKKYSLLTGFVHMFSGITTGLAGIASGYAIGIVGDYCVRGYGQQAK